MRFAVLSDIHANLPALEAVLAEVHAAGISQLVLLGDYVGYFYDAQPVVEMLMQWQHIAIRGNHDRMLIEARNNDELRRTYIQKYGNGLEVAIADFGDKSWEWIESLPERQTLVTEGARIELCHGSPFDPDAYIYPDSPKSLFNRFALIDTDAIWMGHTHWPFLKPGQPWLMNPGSVGQPRDLGGIASWCVFDEETSSVAFRRTEYPISHLAREVQSRDPDLGRNLSTLHRRRIKEIE